MIVTVYSNDNLHLLFYNSLNVQDISELLKKLNSTMAGANHVRSYDRCRLLKKFGKQFIAIFNIIRKGNGVWIAGRNHYFHQHKLRANNDSTSLIFPLFSVIKTK